MDPQRFFTPAQVADICGVAPRSVQKWMESGRLCSYHVPGDVRRIPRKSLLRFLKETGLPAVVPAGPVDLAPTIEP